MPDSILGAVRFSRAHRQAVSCFLPGSGSRSVGHHAPGQNGVNSLKPDYNHRGGSRLCGPDDRLRAPPGSNYTGTRGHGLPTLPFHAFFATGTGMPGIFTLTDPIMVRPVKNSVFQSSPPKPILVVAGWPWMMRPSFLPFGSST